MKYPAFFDQAPTITLKDPLSDFLGSCEDGLLEYGYIDAVKLAGHSCPTVAGAYLMTVKAVKSLYGGETPVRGEIAVAFPDAFDEGVTGVMASVAQLITGAAGEGGFKGIGPNFNRQNLMRFGVSGNAEMIFVRMDTSQRINATFNAPIVPMEPGVRERLGMILQGQADADDERLFKEGWQERVRKILVDHVDDPALIALTQ